MSRAGRAATEEPDDAAPTEATAEEMPPALRAHLLYLRCNTAIVHRYSSLWAGPAIGAAIAEQWMQLVMIRMQQAAAAQTHARAAAAGIALPS